MAKGRKFGTIQHERLLGGHPYGAGQGTSTDHVEFVEEEVWSTTDDGCDDSIHTIKKNIGGDPMNGPRRWATDEEAHVGGLSLAFKDPGKSSSRIIQRGQDKAPSRHMASSAPINVPDYPNFLQNDSTDSIQYDYECDDDSEWVPPHEYLAREYAHSRKTAATSVFEGVGRTLKGRDMSRVRNAVWTQTGFDG